MEFVRIIIAIIIKNVLKILTSFIKVNDRQILFESHHGKQYSCNPRAIYEKMLTLDRSYQYIWVFNDPLKFEFLKHNSNTIICKRRSLKHLYYFASSKIIISNVYKPVEYPVKSSQMFIQTWHGVAYKKVAMGWGSDIHKWNMKQRIKGTSVFISCSKQYTKTLIKKSFGFSGKILEIGYPRNDELINNIKSDLKQQIREQLGNGLDEDDFLVLYAPTYSETDQVGVEKIDIEGVKRVARKRFNKNVVFAFRGHHLQSDDWEFNQGKPLDLGYYFDMQDLLVAADMLITDYSSSMWDFSLTAKPCFLFVPDIEAYKRERGFEIDISSTGIPVCKTNEKLLAAIECFDEDEFIKKMDEYHKNSGSFEKGTASAQMCNFIMRTTDKNDGCDYE